MANPYVGEIRLFAGNFPPLGWAFCDGSIVPISENETLFNLIGTTYGGDGQETFALPDLRGRVPVHQGAGPGLPLVVIGQTMGSETVTLSTAQMPVHRHLVTATSAAANPAAGPRGLLANASAAMYGSAVAPTTPMAANAVSSSGSTQPHNNMAPSLGLNFIISLFGIFPSPS
jgi:microcystin-dependent protein